VARRITEKVTVFWKDESGNEVVTWVVIAALAVGIAAFLFGPDPNSLATALRNAVDVIVSLIPGS